MSGRLRIAVQKSGRLAEKSLAMVEAAGFRVLKGHNELLYRVENAPIDLLRVRDDDIPTFVDDGVADFGIVGRNVLEERGAGASEEVMALGFGRCDLKIAVPAGFAYAGAASLQGLRIATTYPRTLSRFLERSGVAAEIVSMRGAVEVAPRLKLAQAICDLVSTGATLEANGLVAVDTVMASEAVLMHAVQKGGDRQELHEGIRRHSLAAARRMKEDGDTPDLLERIAADPRFHITASGTWLEKS